MSLCRATRRSNLKAINIDARAGPLLCTSSHRGLSHFQVVEHVIPTQHTRHWPRGTEVGQENALKLAVKQYIPKDNLEQQAGDITFIAAHANGFPKVSISGSSLSQWDRLNIRRSYMSLCLMTSKKT